MDLTNPLAAAIIQTMDKLRALQAFIAIVDQGSLTRAAQTTGSSLPAPVRTLAAMESQLGVRLLQRTTRRLALTEDGRQYLERARRIVADVDEADRLVGARQAAPAGTVGVTAPVLFGQRHVAPAVQLFVRRYPQVRVNLVLLDRVVNLVEEGLDVGVRIGPLADSSLVAQQVGRMRRIVVASPGFLRRQGLPQHPKELAALPCLRFNGSDGGLWLFNEGGREFQVSVQGRIECNLSAPMLEACAAGLGLARCLHYQAQPLLQARRLRIVLAGFEVEPWPVQITYPTARQLSTRTRVFIDLLKAELTAVLGAAREP
jgi:DNA-binding transcriptional LysR family regulator